MYLQEQAKKKMTYGHTYKNTDTCHHSYYKLHCSRLIWALKGGYSLSTYGVYDRGKNMITKGLAGNLFSSSFTISSGLKEPTCFPLKVQNGPFSLWHPAENTGGAGGIVLVTHDQQVCKGKSRSHPVCVHMPECHSRIQETWQGGLELVLPSHYK